MKDQYKFMRKTPSKFHCKICCMLCLAYLLSFNVQAQAPNQFSFQGVARDAAGKVIANGSVSLITKINSTPNPDVVYEQVHEATTNSVGVFTIKIGNPLSGDFAAIDWSQGPYFLSINIDPSGGNNPADYIDLGTTQILSVPYALLANKLPDLDPINQKGVFGLGQPITAFSDGPNLIWYPKKDAFKVGTGVGGEISLGEHSVALGNSSTARAKKAIAIGVNAFANVEGGTVLGRYNNVPEVNFEGHQDDRLLQIGNGTADDKRSNALTMMGDGKIVIGTNVLNPKYLLDVGGRIRVKYNARTAGIHFDDSNGIEAGFVGMRNNGDVGFFIGGDWRFWVNEQGNGFLNGNIIQTSDRRLKRNFSPVANSLSKLTNITGQHYFWKDTTKSQELQTGLIAQEVEQYFPELVTTDDKGFKAVNYIGLIPHLIESVKTLKSQTEVIGTLQKGMETMKQMEKEMHELRAELNTMKTATSSNSNNLSK
ncbi:tail fiber domain-containing protein [Dyadobacter sp. CY343]|uniref:tail fiber domain-containing protein n=1 Tax=Dyadobacter sp. CY343 TaxID=2907299 RepID=UPI001F30E436|nr:tail fiber domain-containing protein [Dyadobacter sp. CY343]MCE7060087.1 tail fiber domain-containing protein [Dyadobacter sp. CY343]